jgi:hypothetical protein
MQYDWPFNIRGTQEQHHQVGRDGRKQDHPRGSVAHRARFMGNEGIQRGQADVQAIRSGDLIHTT